jgi:hypothetical protein
MCRRAMAERSEGSGEWGRKRLARRGIGGRGQEEEACIAVVLITIGGARHVGSLANLKEN